MRALVTGSSGFVGRYVVDALIYRGYEVYGIDVKPWPTSELPRGYAHMVRDCREYFTDKEQDKFKYDLVVHCAAVIGGRASIDYSPLSVATNLSIDSMMFHWAMRTEQPRIVYYSSSAAYPVLLQNHSEGPCALDPVKLIEHHLDLSGGPLSSLHWPDQTYGWAKLSGELLAHQANQLGMRVHVFRPFSGYGMYQSMDYPFTAFVGRALTDDPTFNVWSDGTQIRDFIHISDIVSATMRFVELDIVDPVNLGTGRGIAFNDLAIMMLERSMTLGLRTKMPEIIHINDAPRGVSYRVADVTKMTRVYEPRITLEQGVDMALLTMKENTK